MSDLGGIYIKVAASIEGLTAGLNAAVAEMRASFSKMDSSIASTSSKMRGDLAAGAKAAENSFKGVGQSIGDLKSKFAGGLEFLGVAAAAEGVHMLADTLNQAAERAEGFKNSAQLVGATTTEFQGLAAVAAEVGVSQQTLQRGMLTLNQHMTMARDGSKSAREQLAKVGITVKDLANPAFTAANALYTMAKSGAAAGDVQVLLGQRAAMLQAAFGKLAEGQKEMEKQANKVNGLNTAEIATLAKYKEHVAVLGIEYENLKGHVASYIVNASGPLVDAFHKLEASFGATEGGVDILKGTFAVIEGVVIGLINDVRSLVKLFIDLGTTIADVFGGIGTVMHDVLSGNWKALKSDAHDAFTMVKSDATATFKDIGDVMGGNIGKNIQAIKDSWHAAFAEQPKGAPEKRPTPGGGGTGGTKKSHHGNSAGLSAMRAYAAEKHRLAEKMLADDDKEMNEEIRIAQVGYKSQYDAKVQSLDQELSAVKEAARQRMISPEQEFEQEREILQKKLAAQTAYYEQLKALAAGDSLAQAKLDADEQKSQLAYLAAVQKAHQQTTQQIFNQWNSVATRIGNTWSTMITKMLQGNMSFGQMMQRTVQQILTNFIRMETQTLAHHIMTEAAKAEASTASAAIQGAASQDASKQSLLASGEAGLKKIMNDAYQAASGAFNAVVGIIPIGPVLAPIAAATAFAAVAAYGGGIASASGGYDIPSGVNPLTQLHSREMVLPAPLADTVRGMAAGGKGGGGDTHHHYNVSAMDSRSMTEALIGSGSSGPVAQALRTLSSRFALQ